MKPSRRRDKSVDIAVHSGEFGIRDAELSRDSIVVEAVAYTLEHRTEFEPVVAAKAVSSEVELKTPAPDTPLASVTELKPEQPAEPVDSITAARNAVNDAWAA